MNTTNTMTFDTVENNIRLSNLPEQVTEDWLNWLRNTIATCNTDEVVFSVQQKENGIRVNLDTLSAKYAFAYFDITNFSYCGPAFIRIAK